MMNRRLLLSILLGGCATVIPIGAGWTAPEPAGPRRRMALPNEPWPAYPRGQTFGNRWISTGEIFVEVDSPEGEATARESAVNLRSDGTLRHRQHHWPKAW